MLFTRLGITWGNVPMSFTTLGITCGVRSQDFPILGHKKTLKPSPPPKKKTNYGILGGDNFPKLSQKGFIMSQIIPNNGKISHLIPKWESSKVPCELH